MKINARDNVHFLLENIDRLAVSVQPLWHPLGFASCVIKEVVGEVILRVHYWPQNERRTKNPDWPVHTHSYTLSSLVLHGNIEDIQYETTEGDEFALYQGTYFNGDSEINRLGRRVRISECISKTHVKGGQYRVERGVFHQSSVKLSESAVTFVALSESTTDAPLVLGGDGEHKYPYDRTPFNQEIFWSAVRESIESLTNLR